MRRIAVLLCLPVVAAIGSLPEGGICNRPGDVRVTQETFDADGGLLAWDAIMRSYPPCPRPPTVPRDAEAVAVEVLERFPLPAPRPVIAPGRAITGLRAYLEPNLDVPLVAERPTYRGTRATELGEMAVEAVATYTVDWGDAVTGPHRGPGGPWPNGNITHVWTTMGAYDVVVTANWDVTWRVGTETGRLTAPTEGAVPGFPVNQVQAVLRYP